MDSQIRTSSNDDLHLETAAEGILCEETSSSPDSESDGDRIPPEFCYALETRAEYRNELSFADELKIVSDLSNSVDAMDCLGLASEVDCSSTVWSASGVDSSRGDTLSFSSETGSLRSNANSLFIQTANSVIQDAEDRECIQKVVFKSPIKQTENHSVFVHKNLDKEVSPHIHESESNDSCISITDDCSQPADGAAVDQLSRFPHSPSQCESQISEDSGVGAISCLNESISTSTTFNCNEDVDSVWVTHTVLRDTCDLSHKLPKQQDSPKITASFNIQSLSPKFSAKFKGLAQDSKVRLDVLTNMMQRTPRWWNKGRSNEQGVEALVGPKQQVYTHHSNIQSSTQSNNGLLNVSIAEQSLPTIPRRKAESFSSEDEDHEGVSDYCTITGLPHIPSTASPAMRQRTEGEFEEGKSSSADAKQIKALVNERLLHPSPLRSLCSSRSSKVSHHHGITEKKSPSTDWCDQEEQILTVTFAAPVVPSDPLHSNLCERGTENVFANNSSSHQLGNAIIKSGAAKITGASPTSAATASRAADKHSTCSTRDRSSSSATRANNGAGMVDYSNMRRTSAEQEDSCPFTQSLPARFNRGDIAYKTCFLNEEDLSEFSDSEDLPPPHLQSPLYLHGNNTAPPLHRRHDEKDLDTSPLGNQTRNTPQTFDSSTDQSELEDNSGHLAKNSCKANPFLASKENLFGATTPLPSSLTYPLVVNGAYAVSLSSTESSSPSGGAEETSCSRTRAAPLIAMTTHSNDAERERIKEVTEFIVKHRQLEEEAKVALMQTRTMARMQMEMDRTNSQRAKSKNNPALNKILRGERRLDKRRLLGLEDREIHTILESLKSQIQEMNEELVQVLMEKDFHTNAQDDMLIEIEDITRHAHNQLQTLHILKASSNPSSLSHSLRNHSKRT